MLHLPLISISLLPSAHQVSALVEGLSQLTGVCRLALGQNDLTDLSFMTLAGALVSSAACSSLTALDVRHNRLSALAVDDLLPLLQEEATNKVGELTGSQAAEC